MLSPLDGWKDPLIHHNSRNKTSFSLDSFQGGFISILWCHSLTILIWKVSTVNGESARTNLQIGKLRLGCAQGTVSMACIWRSWDLTSSWVEGGFHIQVEKQPPIFATLYLTPFWLSGQIAPYLQASFLWSTIKGILIFFFPLPQFCWESGQGESVW